MKTYFVGESGKDTGGLTREMWSLFSKSIQQSLCEGANRSVLRHDATKLQVYCKPTFLITIYTLWEWHTSNLTHSATLV